MIAAPDSSVYPAVVAHHLRLAGIPATEQRSVRADAVLIRNDWDGAAAADAARVVMVLQPSPATLERFGVHRGQAAGERVAIEATSARSLHPVHTLKSDRRHDTIAVDGHQQACWIAVPHESRLVLLIGSNLGADLTQYRQGDPNRVSERTDAAMWGIPGERPIYLFEHQVPAGSEHERPVDVLVMALAEWLGRQLGRELPPFLPNAAPGLLVITGDDDQAFLDKYQEQSRRLAGNPVTYFLHPLTKHSRRTLDTLARGQRTELGLHPDALEQPAHYDALFTQQADWFERLTGAPARVVRNHGYLNDGYWGHLRSWRKHHIRGSANIPGINGRVLNGSLWPARVATSHELTGHWSMLTLLGDGVRFALGLDGPASARCVTDAADRIVASGIPGVLMVNLHPQNVAETADMHEAIAQLPVTHGFAALTFGECLDWFAARDHALAAHRAA